MSAPTRGTSSLVRLLLPLSLAVFVTACSEDAAADSTTLTFKNGHVEYGTTVSAEEATRLGNYLAERGFFDRPRTVRLDRDGAAYTLSAVANDGGEKDRALLASFRVLGVELSKNVFNDAKVHVILRDETQETGTLIPAPEYGDRLTFNKSDLYYSPPVTREEATRLGNFLVQDGFFAGDQKSARLTREEGVYQFRFMVVEGKQNDPEYVAACREITSHLSRNVFNNAPVEIHLCDHTFRTLLVVHPDPAPVKEDSAR